MIVKKNGRPYKNDYVTIFEFDGDKIIRMYEYGAAFLYFSLRILQVTGNSGHGQSAQLSIYSAGREDKALKLLNPSLENLVAGNVTRMYELIAGDIRNGTRNAPTFGDAVSLHTVLQEIETNN